MRLVSVSMSMPVPEMRMTGVMAAIVGAAGLGPAMAAAAAGKKVLLIDTDPQGTLSIFYAKWATRPERPGAGQDTGRAGTLQQLTDVAPVQVGKHLVVRRTRDEHRGEDTAHTHTRTAMDQLIDRAWIAVAASRSRLSRATRTGRSFRIQRGARC